MTTIRIGAWDLDLAAGTASNGEIAIKVFPHGDGSYSVEYWRSGTGDVPQLIVREILKAFEQASGDVFERRGIPEADI